MTMLLGLSWQGWLLAVAAGFVAGLLYFGSIRLQAGYLVERGGKGEKGDWLLPLALVGRLIFLGAALYLAVKMAPREGVAVVLLCALAGLLGARFLLIRRARSGERGAEIPGETPGGMGEGTER